MTIKEKKANLKTRYETGGFNDSESRRQTLVKRCRKSFRSCGNCLQDESFLAVRRKEVVVRACRLIEKAVGAPKLADLAEAAKMSRYHFHRLFKMVTGVTPKAYATAVLTRRVREELARGSAVADAVYGAGYNSSGRFYATSAERLGMTPTAFRDGGAGVAIRFAVGECSLGSVLVAATHKGICAILLGNDPDLLVRDLQDRFAKADIVPGGPSFDQRVAAAVGLVENPALGLDLPLDLRGTVFQLRVWEALRRIPPGSTASYTEVAERIGHPKAARAVARACSANPIAVAIPCHRVVAKDRSLSGYRWGVERKAELLKREKQRG